MRDIPGLTIDHEHLERGVYVFRRNLMGDQMVIIFDIRMKTPNRGPVLDLSTLHTIEYLVAAYLRNDPEWEGHIIY